MRRGDRTSPVGDALCCDGTKTYRLTEKKGHSRAYSALQGTSCAIPPLRGGEGAVFLAIKLNFFLVFRYARAEPEGGNGPWSW